MMDVKALEHLRIKLRARGLSDEKARTYAALIGDTPEVNAAGKWVIRDDNDVVLDTIDPVED